MASTEPAEPIDPIEPAEPMDRIDPADPSESTDPNDHSDTAEPADQPDSTDHAERWDDREANEPGRRRAGWSIGVIDTWRRTAATRRRAFGNGAWGRGRAMPEV